MQNWSTVSALLCCISVAQAQTVDSRIAEEISRGSTASIIIEMELPSTPESGVNLEKSAANSQIVDKARERISTAREGLASALRSAEVRITRSFEHLPFVVATVDAGQFERVRLMANVRGIYLNERHRQDWNNFATTVPAPAPDMDSEADTDRALLSRLEKSKLNQNVPERAQYSSTNDSINAPAVWAKGFTGQNQVIAVLDDGIDKTHSIFSGKIVAEACFSDKVKGTDTSLCPGGGTTEFGAGTGSNCFKVKSCEHGMHVAGIAAGGIGTYTSGTLKGVAPDAKIYAIQVFSIVKDQEFCKTSSECLGAYTSSTLGALNHLISEASNYTLASVNMSLGGKPVSGTCDTDLRKSAIDTLRQLGVITTIAAGNDGLLNRVEAPGCISTAFTVSSVIITVPDSDVNHSPLVDVLAPGYLILSAGPNNGFVTKSVTSMATPAVAGAIALLKSANPKATSAEIENALRSTGIPSDYIGWTWKTPRIDVSAALTALGTVSSPRGTPVVFIYPSNSTQAQSYLRIHNTSGSSGSVRVTIYDDVTGRKLGVWTKTIPANASIQYFSRTLESEATPIIVPPNDPDTAYTAYIEANFVGQVQHVLYNPIGRSLTNVSGCESGLSRSQKYIGNIHTSLLADYPSYLVVHNNSSVAAKPSFKVYDSISGTYINRFTLSTNMPPFTTTIITMGNILSTFGQAPAAGQNHINVELEGTFKGTIQHTVDNKGAGVITNMTARCDL
jgi:subtilisin family serine protease